MSEVRISIQQHSTLRALKEVLEDKDMFYQVRVAAAYALAGLKGDGDEPVGRHYYLFALLFCRAPRAFEIKQTINCC